MVFVPQRQRLWSVLTELPTVEIGGEGVEVLHAGTVVPQTIVFAVDPPPAQPERGILAVTETDLETARYAIGFDSILEAATAASRDFGPNGWAHRGGETRDPPPGPRVAELGLVLDDDLVETTMRWDLASITLAKGPRIDADVSATSPVPVAMLAAAELGVEVFLAAGNDGPADGTLNGWASDAALVVGATSDEAGTTIDERSSRGVSGERGPDLVAWAASSLDANVQGTSFAAPRAAYQHAIATTVANAILAVAATVAGGDRGTPITTVGVVDWGEPVRPGPLARLLARNPTAGVDSAGVIAVLGALSAGGRQVDIDCLRPRRAEVVRRWILDACRPIDEPAHVGGVGFLDGACMRAFLRALTGAHIAGLFAPGADLDELAGLPDLKGIAIASGDMWRALDIYSQTTGLAYYDHDQRRLVAW